MNAQEELIHLVASSRDKGVLKFLTCGSVDDGKSTLLGRLLYDTKKIYRDQLSALETDSKRFGTTGGEIDLALLLDGLKSEREQGITIDVAYRYFSTDRRSFIVADTPGHEQYTRNMATGASNAELAVILVDARHGVLRQTRRHSHIVSALGIGSVIVAVNKMDSIGYSRERFDEIKNAYGKMAASLDIPDIYYIPLSALEGDNVVDRSKNMSWYEGQTLLERLETVDVSKSMNKIGLRFPVQLTSRPNQNFRGFSGTLASGSLRLGQEIKVLPSGARSHIARILDGDGDIETAKAGEAVTVSLADEVDAGRGSIIVDAGDGLCAKDRSTARIVWMSEEPLRKGSIYDAKVGNQSCQATVEGIVSQIDLDTNEECNAEELAMNDLGIVSIRFTAPIVFDEYVECRRTGSFILIDRVTNGTAGAGMIIALQESPIIREKPEVFWHKQSVAKAERAAIKRQRPRIVWLTGLSGSGKSTIGNALERELNTRGFHTYLLDGDNLRHGLTKDLGFTREDRAENIRRAGEVARLMLDAGLIVICAFVSPYRSERDAIRAAVEKGEFVEVYISTPLEVCRQRDTKGFYKKGDAGLMRDFTGVNAPYEAPLRPELEFDSSSSRVDESINSILEFLKDADTTE
jgi:bifunctional enzyme CysN/CysC